MRRGAFMVAAAAVLSLAACSGDSATGLDQLIYNATFVGQGAIQRSPTLAGTSALAPPVRFTMTLAQLGQDFSGIFSLADSSGKALYSGGVTGRTTSTGADFVLVVPPPCIGTLYGSFTVSNGALTGSAAGRDCGASAAGNNVQITFTNLVRQ